MEEIIDKVKEAIDRLKPYGEIRILMTPDGENVIIYETQSEKLKVEK